MTITTSTARPSASPTERAGGSFWRESFIVFRRQTSQVLRVSSGRFEDV